VARSQLGKAKVGACNPIGRINAGKIIKTEWLQGIPGSTPIMAYAVASNPFLRRNSRFSGPLVRLVPAGVPSALSELRVAACFAV